jgi:3-hydroxyacyl-[acyl-carrier-protein] dehydratase
VTPRDLLALVPWRQPFLMVDRIVSCVPGEQIVTLKNVTADQGHSGFPSVLLLEGMGQSAALLFRLSRVDPAPPGLPLLGYLRASVAGAAAPGDRVLYEVRAVKMTSSGGVFEARARLDGNVIAEAELALSASPAPATSAAGGSPAP